jgi:hypothetical protein
VRQSKELDPIVSQNMCLQAAIAIAEENRWKMQRIIDWEEQRQAYIIQQLFYIQEHYGCEWHDRIALYWIHELRQSQTILERARTSPFHLDRYLGE